MTIAVLIGMMIAVVVGVNLIPTVINTVSNATQEVGEEATAISSLIGILPYIFVAVIIIGAVAWMGVLPDSDNDNKRERREKVKAFFKNPREIILRIEESSRNWSQYINNLDNLLGIKTIVAGDNLDVPGIIELNGLYLSPDKELWIDRSYNWYIADKLLDGDIFKIVGLHKKNASLNRVYLLGVKDNKEPYLIEVPAEIYLEASCKQCLSWTESHKVEEKVVLGV